MLIKKQETYFFVFVFIEDVIKVMHIFFSIAIVLWCTFTLATEIRCNLKKILSTSFYTTATNIHKKLSIEKMNVSICQLILTNGLSITKHMVDVRILVSHKFTLEMEHYYPFSVQICSAKVQNRSLNTDTLTALDYFPKKKNLKIISKNLYQD